MYVAVHLNLLTAILKCTHVFQCCNLQTFQHSVFNSWEHEWKALTITTANYLTAGSPCCDCSDGMRSNECHFSVHVGLMLKYSYRLIDWLIDLWLAHLPAETGWYLLRLKPNAGIHMHSNISSKDKTTGCVYFLTH